MQHQAGHEANRGLDGPAFIARISGGDPMSGFAADLLDEADFGHDHPPVHRLAHVVNREQADLHGR